MIPTATVLGVRLYASSLAEAAEAVCVTCTANEPKIARLVSATGAHGIIHANENPSFMDLLSGFYMNLPDGMPGVWVGRIKGAKSMERCYGPDFFGSVMHQSAQLPIRHYFCGGKEGVADNLKAAVSRKFGNENVVGTHCPPFRELSEEEFAALGKDISDRQVDVVWVGISTPKQEWFAYRLSKHANVHFIATVGAAFDFHIGAVRQAPPLLQRAGLEWLFRLAMEPRRLYRRYLKIVPKFIYLNVGELLRSALPTGAPTE